jgi:hypothetical protein
VITAELEQWREGVLPVHHELGLAGNIATGMIDRGPLAMIAPSEQLSAAMREAWTWWTTNPPPDPWTNHLLGRLQRVCGAAASAYGEAVAGRPTCDLVELQRLVDSMNFCLVQFGSKLDQHIGGQDGTP